ncbi:toxin HicA [Prescottella subtropica]|uniref:toxin HicA n=1 Tax=Prescottella subtropica TaxID=2545757 RepID=UPI0010F90ACA|nr:toxin HicA [Prescottella subtropica]
MRKREKLLARMRTAPQNITYDELLTLCTDLFGPPRQNSGSHAKFQTPWPGPRLNIQRGTGGKAKQYQVTQVLAAIERMEDHPQ